MPRYEWTRDEPFRDTRNDRRVHKDEIVELSENVAEPAYGFRRVEAEESHSESQPETPNAEPDTEAETQICGVEMTDGSICERPADSCPYHD